MLEISLKTSMESNISSKFSFLRENVRKLSDQIQSYYAPQKVVNFETSIQDALRRRRLD